MTARADIWRNRGTVGRSVPRPPESALDPAGMSLRKEDREADIKFFLGGPGEIPRDVPSGARDVRGARSGLCRGEFQGRDGAHVRNARVPVPAGAHGALHGEGDGGLSAPHSLDTECRRYPRRDGVPSGFRDQRPRLYRQSRPYPGPGEGTHGGRRNTASGFACRSAAGEPGGSGLIVVRIRRPAEGTRAVVRIYRRLPACAGASRSPLCRAELGAGGQAAAIRGDR